MSARRTKLPLPTTSSYPQDTVQTVELSNAVRALSYQISEERHGGTLAASVESFFKKYELEADDARTAAVIQEMNLLIQADETYDSEANQAYRAGITAFLKHMPCAATKGYPVYQTIKLTGWFAGQVVIVNGHRYELTGRACPNCAINPEAYGASWSGVRCVDQITCRWEYCI